VFATPVNLTVISGNADSSNPNLRSLLFAFPLKIAKRRLVVDRESTAGDSEIYSTVLSRMISKVESQLKSRQLCPAIRDIRSPDLADRTCGLFTLS